MVEWKNWKTVYKDTVKEDSHHAEIVDISTGEVLKDTSLNNTWDYSELYDVGSRNRVENRYKDKIIRRNNVGDCFCSTDWSRK